MLGLLPKKVFKVYISGTITDQTYTKFLKDLNKTQFIPSTPLAVVINSPGGSAVHSDLIYKRIRAYASINKVQVFTFAEDFAASGGYYIMCSGDYLYASSTLSLIGSIGAVSAIPNIKDFATKYGIERRYFSTNPLDFFATTDPLQDYNAEKSKKISSVLKEVNEEFKKIILANRKDKLTVGEDKRNDVIFNGDVFLANKALEYGLIDSIGRCDDVIKEKFPDAKIVDLSREKLFTRLTNAFKLY
ncbi:hypothetical protein SteCoe_17441 [Stentor coeruleus]|uniref:Peptidase S49 domain-containing protein n=1 Tax=Stentor coeruleus TaxID=5963 RepID=A0A1R2BYU2_9CILI|nr:hypothetical protein SteCoe_17441 [Stentor coeruleus]